MIILLIVFYLHKVEFMNTHTGCAVCLNLSVTNANG